MDDSSGDLQWRQGWLAVGLPPGPVLAVSGIVFFFLYLTWQIEEYEEQLRRRTQAGFFLLLVLGLVALAVISRHALLDADGRAVVVPASWWRGQDGGAAESGGGGGTSPWAVAAVVVLLLVLASHKPSFQMFRPPFK